MSAPPSRRPTSRWIAGLVVLGAAALLAGTVGRRYLEKFAAPPAASAPAPDARVAEYLRKAETLMNDAEFEDARAELDKASALAEGNVEVLAELARLEALRADVLWLRLRLLDPADENIVKATHRQLGGRVGRAEEAVARAKSAAPEEPAVVRSDVDVLRLAGKLSEARARVGPVAQSPSEPENAYVLAALDMAESTPAWAPVIDRLRTAAAAERGLGRARAALVYALVRDGRVSEAEGELAKLKERGKNHPLFEDLTAFVERHVVTGDAGVDAAVEVATVDPTSLPVLDTSGDGDEPIAEGGDFRAQLKQASAAFKRGDLDKAEQLYSAVLAKHPGNTEALAGLGDVARQKRDPDTAQKMYEKVLEKNPSYLPALIAQADAKWESGDRKGAQAIYKRILEQAGAGSSYGQKAAARLAEPAGGGGTGGGAGAEPKPEPKPSATAAPEEPTEPPKKEDKPHIDTTDLPEFN